MREQIKHRRGFLQVLGAASTGLLAGCSTGGSENQSLASQSSTILDQLPRLEQHEYSGDVLKVESFIPEKLGAYKGSMAHLQTLDKAVPLEFDIDIGSLVEGFVALDQMIVSLTAPNGESFSSSITDPGTEAGSIDSYTVYEHNEGLFGLDDNRLLFVRPDDRLTIDTREVLERIVDAETGDEEDSTLTDREKAAAETVEAVDADHLLSVVVPFDQDVFGDETGYVSGARAVAWGLTAGEKDNGAASVASKIVARFPSGEAVKGPFLPFVHDNMPVRVDINTSSVDGDLVTAHGEDGFQPNDGENSYLRPRGLSDAVFVQARASQWEWKFDYPNLGVIGAEELVIPVDRPTVVGAFSTDVKHSLGVPALELGVGAETGRDQYGTVTPSETGDFSLRCYELCGKGHSDHTATTRVVDTAEFEEWVSSQ